MTTPTPPDDPAERLKERMHAVTPQGRALGLEWMELSWENGVTARLRYRPEIVGDADTGVVAGGAVTTMLDEVCGQAVHMHLRDFEMSIATLDLRIDYMRPAEPGLDVFAHAHCYKATRSVAFIRAVAYDRDPADPVAAVQAAFMLDSQAGRPTGANLTPAPRKSRSPKAAKR
jgi:uncharacterized protein (TIGR00369 family)